MELASMTASVWKKKEETHRKVLLNSNGFSKAAAIHLRA